MRHIKKIVVALVLILSATVAHSACSGSGLSWTCSADSSVSQINTAITSADSGAMITVSAGSGTWSGTINISKSIILTGSGTTSTYITGGNIGSLNGGAFRITGFNFDGTTIGISESTPGGSNGWRVDHNIITQASSDASFTIAGNASSTCTTHPTGVIDNNYFTLGQVLIIGDMATGADNGDDMWFLTDPMGAGTNVVYIESNTFYAASMTPYAIDSNYGGRYVARYNTLINRAWEHHGIQGTSNRGLPRWEIYNNSFSTTGSYWTALYIRSGGGVVFNNTISSGFTGSILVDNQTSCRYGTYAENGVGCDGYNPRDGNRSGLHGYPCRDQIGRSSGDSPKGHTGDTQKLNPIYSFLNTIDGTETGVVLGWDEDCSRNIEHVAANRDYYNGAATAQVSSSSPFSGATGVGYGTLTNRPTTCTTNADETGGGVGYWATDTNTLYRCSATNTWTTHYTPYTYPHPLRGEGAEYQPGPGKRTGGTSTGTFR